MNTLIAFVFLFTFVSAAICIGLLSKKTKWLQNKNQELANDLSYVDGHLRAFQDETELRLARLEHTPKFKDETELRLARLEHTPKFKVGDIVVIETKITGEVSAIITKCFYAGKLDLLLTYSCKVENGNTVDLYEYQLRPYVKPEETKKKDKK